MDARLIRLLACAALLVPGATGAAGPETLYVALGGWGDAPGTTREGDPARIAATLGSARPIRLVDLTVPGVKIRDVREEQLSRAIALRPALVSISVGPLDVLSGTSLAAFSHDLQTVTDLLRGTRSLVVISTIPRGNVLRPGASARLKRRADAFNWAILRAARRNGLVVADVRTPGDGTWHSAVARRLQSWTAAPRH